jgi:hypothetical protein
MVYIIGEKGFFAGKIKKGSGKNTKMVPQWTTKVSEAQSLSSKIAKTLLNNGDIIGVIWKPYEEKHTTKKYKVVLITNNYIGDFFPHYSVVQHYNAPDSDLKYLLNRGKKEDIELYTKKEAEQVVIKKNTELIEKLKELNNNSKKEYANNVFRL